MTIAAKTTTTTDADETPREPKTESFFDHPKIKNRLLLEREHKTEPFLNTPTNLTATYVVSSLVLGQPSAVQDS